MATTFQLRGTPRADKGKGAARKLRAAAQIPAVIYGKGSEPVLIQVGDREFRKTVSGHAISNMIIDLDLGDGSNTKALIREIQTDPVENTVLHVDFNRISMTEMIEIEVPIELHGVPIGVKDFGGLLAHTERSVMVRCLPGDVPERIDVDVSALNLGDSIFVRDLSVPGTEIIADPDTMITGVSAPKRVEEVVAEEVEEGAEGEAPAEGAEAKKPEEDAS